MHPVMLDILSMIDHLLFCCSQEPLRDFLDRCLWNRWMQKNSLTIGLLCRSLFLLKTGFWPSYCQISTDLDRVLHTPIAVCNTFVGPLRPR